MKKTIVFYDNHVDADGEVQTYDGKKKRYLSMDLVKEAKKNPNDFDETFVKFERKKKTDTIESAYDTFISHAKSLKKITDGKINLYESGSYAASAYKLFRELTPDIVPEPIPEWEAELLADASIGALRYAQKNYEGKGYKYDICSSYPYIMKAFNFPIKAGKLVELEAIPKVVKYGLYRCKISRVDARLFFTNKKSDWYTNIDIQFARKKGYKIKLIQDDEPNHLSYEGCLISGKKLFGPFVDYLFPLKKQGFQGVKEIINVLWGKLIQANIVKLKFNSNTTSKVFANEEPMMICPMDDGYAVELIKSAKRFETNFARIKPFMFAAGRMRMTHFLDGNEQNLIYSHTDGFVLTKRIITNEINETKMGNELGMLKYEGKCNNIVVKNMAARLSQFEFII